MYHIAICDDHQEFIDYTEKLVLESPYGKDSLFYEYLSGEALIQNMDTTAPYDLLILDMQLKKMDGNATARKFREKFPNTLLVFISGVHLPTVRDFEVSPFRYLLKNYTQDHMKREFDNILQKMQEVKKIPSILAKRNNIRYKLSVDKIYYIELARRGSVLYCQENQEDTEYTTTSKLKELYETLEDYGFAFAHNSYLVNMEHVILVGPSELELDNGKKLSIARSKSKKFRERYAEYIGSKY